MRSTALFAALITAIVLSGCTVRENEVTVIGGADGPTAIYLAHEADGEEDKSPDTNEEEKANGSEEFLAGTWVTASQGYEYYGKAQAEYYVRFDGTDIIYGHMKGKEFIPDHTAAISIIEQVSGGGYMVKAKSENGGEYTYRSADGNLDVLEYYSTWNEDDFPNHYSGGASLSREYDREVKNTYESDFGKYYEMDDGTWVYEGRSYKYRLEITGRMNNAVKESTFIYLSNIEDIPFDRAVMASGLSSNMADYFSPDEAVFVGWKE